MENIRFSLSLLSNLQFGCKHEKSFDVGRLPKLIRTPHWFFRHCCLPHTAEGLGRDLETFIAGTDIHLVTALKVT